MKRGVVSILALSATVPFIEAFTVPAPDVVTRTTNPTATSRRGSYPSLDRHNIILDDNKPSTATTTTTTTALGSTSGKGDDDDDKSGGALEGGVRNKLLAETIAPWRTIRLFLYGALGSGAALGGFITLTGVLAALNGARTDIDLNTEYVNLAIDFGAVLAFAIFAKIDWDKQSELEVRVADRVERRKDQEGIVRAMRRREEELADLELKIQVSGDGSSPPSIAKLGELQRGAKQHLIILIGPKLVCKEALIGANFIRSDFVSNNVLLVPYVTNAKRADDVDNDASRPTGTGFDPSSTGSKFENQPFVAKPAGDGWADYVRAEMDDAKKQSESMEPETKGIAIVLANNGKVIRRGIGRIPFVNIFEDLNEAVVPGSKTQPVDYLFE